MNDCDVTTAHLLTRAVRKVLTACAGFRGRADGLVD
jgi:hypothetical protein